MLRNYWRRYQALVAATAIVGLSVAALWAKWSSQRFSSSGWPHDAGRAMGWLFAAGVMFAFGAAVVSRVLWRRALQAIAVTCLIAMLVFPIDLDRWLPPPTFEYRHDERWVTMRCRPNVEHGQYADVLILAPTRTAEPPTRLYVGPELASKLQVEHAMDFTFWRTRDVLLPNWRVRGHVPPWEDTLETVRDGEQMLYDARMCPIHHVAMQRMELPIHYGLPAHGREWAEFSGGPGFVEGGCLVAPLQTTMGYRCPVCAARYQEWAAAFRHRVEHQAPDASVSR